MRVARAAGLDVAWTVDHLQGFFPQVIWDKDLTFLADPSGSPHEYYDYQALLGYLARRAGRMHLAVGVTEPVRRHPVVLAQTALTLAHMTKRTLILGLGSGEAENTVPYGLPFKRPVARLEEAIQIIQKCFSSRGPFDFSGEFYQLERAVLDLRPPKDRTPQLWVAAHGPRMLGITGRYGDGWYPTLPYTPQEYGDALGTIRDAATAAQRRPHSIVPGWQTLVVLGKDEAAARRLLEHRSVRFTALLAPDAVWRAHGAAHPLGEGFGGLVDFVPRDYERAVIDAAIDRVPTDLLAGTLLWGTPDMVYTRLRDFVDAGLRHVVLGPLSALASRSDAAFSVRSAISILRRLKRDGL